MGKAMKFLVVSMLAAFLAVGVFALAGCSSSSSSDESDVKEVTEELFDTMKACGNGDADALALVEEEGGLDSSSSEVSMLESYGISVDDLMQSMLSGFDYSIDSVSVEDDTATVQLTFTTKTSDTLTAALENIDASSITDESEIGSVLLQAIDSAEMESGLTATATLTKEDGTWDTENNGEALANAWASVTGLV